MRLGQHMTEEQRAALMGNKRAFGHHHEVSVEVRAHMSAAKIGHVTSPETCAKISAAKMGHVASPETLAKMSAAQMGRLAWNKGISPSNETRAKLSVAIWKGGKTVSKRKSSSKRRTLGFHPLNSPFPGSDAHHINKDDVIHMPHELHNSIYHNQNTGKGMAEMNALAGQYLMEHWT